MAPPPPIQPAPRRLPVLLPAWRHVPRPQPHRGTSFYDLPAELRIEIYKLALSSVKIHILPPNSIRVRQPHALVRTSRQVRNEVLPLIHKSCAINVEVTDFNFDGLLEFMTRIPSEQEVNLRKNPTLQIQLSTTSTPNGKKDKTSNSMKNTGSLRKWLHLRADPHRPQPNWVYCGPQPDVKTSYEMRRRAKRTKKKGERRELMRMLKAISVDGIDDSSSENEVAGG